MPREANRPGHVLERGALAAALLDEAEDLSEQRLVVEPEITYHDRCQSREYPPAAEHQVSKYRLPVAVVPLTKLWV